MPSASACLFCGSARHELRFRASDRWFPVHGVFNMRQCLDCGLLFVCPQPSADALAAHYPPDYYAFEGERPDDRRDAALYELFYGERPRALRKLLALPYRPVLRTMPGGRGARLLDVGCGSGHFLAIAKKVLQADAFGVEPWSYNAAFAAREGLNIFPGTLEQAAFPDAFFDAVTLNHVFEHLPDPRAALNELRRILKPGGTLVVGVPQSRCLLYWLFGKHWWQLDVPRHMFVPSSANLLALATRAGFIVQRIRYNSTSTSLLATFYCWRNAAFGREAYLRDFRQRPLAFRALLPLAYLLNLLRIADQIEIVLTRPRLASSG